MVFTSHSDSCYPDFTFCGTFNGKDGQPGHRWLQKFEYEHERHLLAGSLIAPETYLRTVNMLLVEDAEIWADTTAQVVELFLERSPCQDDVETFKALFTLKYPARAMIPFDFTSEIRTLCQGSGESLESYYNRVRYLTCLAGVDEFPEPRPIPALPKTKATVLEVAIAAFIRGLFDKNLMLDTVKGLSLRESSLTDVYQRAKKSKLAVAKDLKYYEELVEEMHALSRGQSYDSTISVLSTRLSAIDENDIFTDESSSSIRKNIVPRSSELPEDGQECLASQNLASKQPVLDRPSEAKSNKQNHINRQTSSIQSTSLVSRLPKVSKRLFSDPQASPKKSSPSLATISKSTPVKSPFDETVNQGRRSATNVDRQNTNSIPPAGKQKHDKATKKRNTVSQVAAAERDKIAASLNNSGTPGRGLGLTLRSMMEDTWSKNPQKAEKMTSFEFLTALGETLHEKSLEYGAY